MRGKQVLKLIVDEVASSKNGTILLFTFIDEYTGHMNAFIDVYNQIDGQKSLKDISESLVNLLLKYTKYNYPIKQINVVKNNIVDERNFYFLSELIEWHKAGIDVANVLLLDEPTNDVYLDVVWTILNKLDVMGPNYMISKNKAVRKISMRHNHFVFDDEYDIYIMNRIVKDIQAEYNNKLKTGRDSNNNQHDKGLRFNVNPFNPNNFGNGGNTNGSSAGGNMTPPPTMTPISNSSKFGEINHQQYEEVNYENNYYEDPQTQFNFYEQNIDNKKELHLQFSRKSDDYQEVERIIIKKKGTDGRNDNIFKNLIEHNQILNNQALRYQSENQNQNTEKTFDDNLDEFEQSGLYNQTQANQSIQQTQEFKSNDDNEIDQRINNYLDKMNAQSNTTKKISLFDDVEHVQAQQMNFNEQKNINSNNFFANNKYPFNFKSPFAIPNPIKDGLQPKVNPTKLNGETSNFEPSMYCKTEINDTIAKQTAPQPQLQPQPKKMIDDEKSLAYNEDFGDFEISVNIMKNKIGFYACECQSNFMFTYANEFNKKITMYDITIAFNLLMDFIKQNKLPIKKFYVENNETYKKYRFFEDERFVRFLNQYIDVADIFLINMDEFLVLKENQIIALNKILKTDHVFISNYGHIFNDTEFEYYDHAGNLSKKCTPKQYIMSTLHKKNQWTGSSAN